MTSTIKVDNVQNQPGTNVVNKCGTTVNIGAASDNIRSAGNNLQASDGGNLISQSGTTVTLGASGDTIALASGASQTGFGRTGTVDWDTSIKTGTVTAVTGKGYFVDTTSGGITVNLPAAAVGSIVAISDYASTSASNNITITPNGSEKINAVNDDYIMSTAGLAVTLVYADATRGWKSVTGSDADATGITPAFVTATGGTPCSGAIVCTNYKIHTFTGPGTFCVSDGGNALGSNTVAYLVVAGGAGGGGGAGSGYCAGGGGAGGFREGTTAPSVPYTASPLVAATGITVTASPYPIDVGGGGAGAPGTENAAPAGTPGVNSTFSTITSAGGGGGGSRNTPSGGVYEARDGGSGGGAGQADNCAQSNTFGIGNTPPVSPDQGFNGGRSSFPNGSPGDSGTGAGGGATAVGGNSTPGTALGGNGGAGATTNISNTPTAYAGGGGGAGTPASGGCGGTGGGGNGSGPGQPTTAGAVNTGGGGGGGSGNSCRNGGTGGSGIVILRYKFQ